MDNELNDNKYRVINLDTLIRCYERSAGFLNLTSYPNWIKKYLQTTLIVLVITITIISMLFNLDLWVFVSILSTYIICLLKIYSMCSKHLKKKYLNTYGLRINPKKRWTDLMTNKVRKERLKNILGNHIENDELISRIKTQLLEEISYEKKSLQTNIPIWGFASVFIASYIGFKLKFLESKVDKVGKLVVTEGEDFLYRLCLIIGFCLLVIIIYRPLVEKTVNKKTYKLIDLLKILETIEIEYLSTKTK